MSDFISGVILGCLFAFFLSLIAASPTLEESAILVRGVYPEASYIEFVSETIAFVKSNESCYRVTIDGIISYHVVSEEMECPK